MKQKNGNKFYFWGTVGLLVFLLVWSYLLLKPLVLDPLGLIVEQTNSKEIRTAHHISGLTLAEPYLYFGAGYCLYKLQIPQRELETILCTPDWTFSKPAVADQQAYVQVLRYPQAGQYLVAVDVNSGEKLWQVIESRSGPYFAGLKNYIHLVNNQVITARRRGIYAFDVQTGRQIWRRWPTWMESPPYIIGDDGLWYITDDHTIAALDVHTGRTKQNLEIACDQVLYIDEQLLIGRVGQEIIAFQHHQLDIVVWSTALEVQGNVKASPVTEENSLLIKDEATVYLINITTGEVRWTFDPTQVTQNIATYPLENIVLFTLWTYDEHRNLNRSLYAVTGTSGTLLWEYEGRPVNSEPIVNAEVVYIANQYSIDALDLKTGKLLWQVEVDSAYEYYYDPS